MRSTHLCLSLTFLISFLLLISCKQSTYEGPVIENKIYHINADSSIEQIDLKLSDLADSFRLIRLETSGKAFINASSYYVSEKYIIAFSQDGIYKFSSDGKFLKKITSWGRGPDEISGFMFAEFYDEKNDLLYIDDVNLKNKLLVYDLTSDKFIRPIKKAIEGPWGSFAIYNDSLILGRSTNYNLKDSEQYSIFFQTFDGKFVSGVRNYKKVIQGKSEVFQSTSITVGNGEYRVHFTSDDTLFAVKDKKLVPFLILDFKNPRERLPNSIQKKGDRYISFPRTEAPSFLIIAVSITEEAIYTSNAIKEKNSRKYFFFNKSTGNSRIIRTYTDDFSGSIQSTAEGSIRFPLFLKNGKLVSVYEPRMIKQMVDKGTNTINLSTDLRNELLKINNNLLETDNPILLIGKIREKI